MNSQAVLAVQRMIMTRLEAELEVANVEKPMPQVDVVVHGDSVHAKMLCCSAGIGQSVLPHGERYAVTTVTNFILDHTCKR